MTAKRSKPDVSSTNAFEPWQPSRTKSFLIARSPVLPFDVVESWGESLGAPALVARWLDASADDKPALRAEVEAALARDRSVIREKIRRLISSDPRVTEAIYIASPSLLDRLDVWLRDPTSEGGARVEAPLYRYITRMSSRAMAFGLFSGTMFGRLGPITDVSSIDGRGFQRKTDLDVWALYLVAERLLADPEIRRTLVYRPNATLFAFGPHYRFVATAPKEVAYGFDVGLVERDAYVDAVRARAEGGARFEELVQVVQALKVSVGDAEAYVHQLIDEQLLTPDIFPAPSSADQVGTLLERLAREPATRPLSQMLSNMRSGLAALDGSFGHAAARYREVVAPVGQLPGIEAADRTIRAALLKTEPEIVLGERVVRDAMGAVDFLRKVPRARSKTQEQILDFARSFVSRYEGRAVPLLEALDPDAGIGFGEEPTHQPLLTDLPVEGPPERAKVNWDRWTHTLFKKLTHAIRERQRTITLEESDLPIDANAKMPAGPMPDVVDLFMRLGRSPDGDPRDPYQVHFGLAVGPQSGIVASRFAYDDKVRDCLESIYRGEEDRSDAIVAEVVHFVRAPAAFALSRRGVRRYEIPCPDAPSVGDEFVLPLSDLDIQVLGDRVRIYSRRHKKRVLPRLTTAHSFPGAPCAPYRFLATLQFCEERSTALSFSWGALGSAPFLPRVMFKNVVLARASWRFDKREMAGFDSKSADERFIAMQVLRRARDLPRYVIANEGDQELIADLDNPLSVETLLDVLAKAKEPSVEEMLPSPGELVGTPAHGRFVNDVRLTCLTERAASPPAGEPKRSDIRSSAPTSTMQRQLRPGSECLFVKLYAGHDAAQDLLRQVVAPFANEQRGNFDRWFFLYYGDPDWHVRLRFLGNADTLQRTVWPALQQRLATPPWDVRIHRVELATYQRELERYGGPAGIELSESLFDADSGAALAVLESVSPDDMWKAAFLGVHRLLRDLGFEGQAMLDVVAAAHRSFRSEFGSIDALDQGLSRRFRAERAELEAMTGNEPSDVWGPTRTIFDERSSKIVPIANALRAAEGEGRLLGTLASIAPSYVHMSVLRLLPRSNRAHEYALLDFLQRVLTGQLARKSR